MRERKRSHSDRIVTLITDIIKMAAIKGMAVRPRASNPIRGLEEDEVMQEQESMGFNYLQCSPLSSLLSPSSSVHNPAIHYSTFIYMPSVLIESHLI